MSLVPLTQHLGLRTPQSSPMLSPGLSRCSLSLLRSRLDVSRGDAHRPPAPAPPAWRLWSYSHQGDSGTTAMGHLAKQAQPDAKCWVCTKRAELGQAGSGETCEVAPLEVLGFQAQQQFELGKGTCYENGKKLKKALLTACKYPWTWRTKDCSSTSMPDFKPWSLWSSPPCVCSKPQCTRHTQKWNFILLWAFEIS